MLPNVAARKPPQDIGVLFLEEIFSEVEKHVNGTAGNACAKEHYPCQKEFHVHFSNLS
jgi:hypothetical protein